MVKDEVRLTQVYRINGRLVVANSIEGAINTWCEWMSPNCPEIRGIERMANDSYGQIGDDALVYAEGLCGDNTHQLTEDIARPEEECERLKHKLKEAMWFIEARLPRFNSETWLPHIEHIKSVYAAAGILKNMNEHTDASNLEELWGELKALRMSADVDM